MNEALAQAKKPLPVIASLGYVGEKAYFIAERTHALYPKSTWRSLCQRR
ncbi:hypothetical protein ACU42Y_17115 [Proteus mirabilis]